ncbi:MAG: glycosyltransferase family 4 protein [Bacteroidota bacterium]
MKILMLCTKPPWPAKDGGTLAMLNMVRAYHQLGHKVTVLTMNTSKHYLYLRNLPTEIQEMATFVAVDVNTSISYIDFMANLLFSKDPYHIQRFTSRPFLEEVKRMLKNKGGFDVVQLETLYTVPYAKFIQAESDALVSFRAHNIEHEIWDRRSRNMRNPFKRFAYAETAYRLKSYEAQAVTQRSFDVMVPITNKDAGSFRFMGADLPIHVAPVGMDLKMIQKIRGTLPCENRSVFYLGAMDWEPNIEGMDWFLKEVWPLVHARFPDVPFYLAGRNMPPRYMRIAKQNIQVVGEVESAEEFIQSKGIMVAPILSGSGMRVKVVEGMAHGKPIVATPVAVEGIGPKHGEQIMIEGEPEDFAERIIFLLQHKDIYELMGQKAAAFIERGFENRAVTDKLIKFYQTHLKQKKGR